MQLLNKFFRKKTVCRGIVGISFLQNGIAVAVSEFTENNKLTLIHCEFIDAEKPEDQQAMLGELATQHNLAEYDCHLVLTTDNYRRINVETPAVAENEIIEAIRWKINELIDFPVDKAVIDYYQPPMPVRANSSKMLEVIASPIDIIREQIEKCTQAGLQLKIIDIQETTLRNLAVHTPENERGIALLYLLEFSGTLLIQKEATIYVSRKFEIGYKKLGLDDHNPAPAAVNAQNNLALEIQRSLDYVESYYGIPPISALAVIPLAENTHNLLDSLSSNLGLAAHMIDLSTIIDCDILVGGRTQSLCAPVIGATLRYVIEAKQQVNLYQDILRQEQNKSGINLYWVGLPTIALLFIGFSVYLMWNTKNTETQVQQLRRDLAAEQAKVNLISSKIPKQEINTQLAAEVAQWQNMLDELTQTIKLLSGKSPDQSSGFSSHFQALSNQSIPEVWLSALYLDRQQQVINIEGSTFKPEKIAYFLQQLQKEPIFNGHTFAKLIMQKSEKIPNQIDFKLGTTLEARDKKDHAQ